MKFGRTARALPSLVGMTLFLGSVLSARTALACRSDEECKAPRTCVMGACVSPPGSNAPQCERDIDCSGADVCEHNLCVPMMSGVPSELPETPMPREPGAPEPGLQITPHKAPEGTTTPPSEATPPPATTPPTPAPDRAPPPSPRRPRPPPDAVITAPPDEPPTLVQSGPYTRRQRPPLYPPRFDLFGGLGFLFLESPFRSTTTLGLGLDAQFLVGVAPSLAIGLRAGGVMTFLNPERPNTADLSLSMGYVAPGVFIPQWRTGFFIGGVTAKSPRESRQWGVQLELPYEYPIAPFLKVGVVLGLGIFPGLNTLYERTLRIEVGF